VALPAGQHKSPDYAALAGAIRGLLADGRLPLGVRLPAERELAEALRISRTTVTAAYRALRESGHLTSRRGRGELDHPATGHRVATSACGAPFEDPHMIDMGVAASATRPSSWSPRPREPPTTSALPGQRGLPPDPASTCCRESVAAGTRPAACPTSVEQI